jgi:hypothetical protein
MSRFMKDLAIDRSKNPEGALKDQWDPEDGDEDEDDDTEINIVDRSESGF